MIVYVESNFPLQFALGQEQVRAADDLLQLAEQNRLTLVIPALSLSEPFSTVAQRERTRRNLRSNLSEQLRQLRRSEPHQDAATALEPLLQYLQGLEREEFGRLQAAVVRILVAAQTVPFDAEVFAGALDVQQCHTVPHAVPHACVSATRRLSFLFVARWLFRTAPWKAEITCDDRLAVVEPKGTLGAGREEH